MRATASIVEDDVLYSEMAERLLDRLRDIKKTFPKVWIHGYLGSPSHAALDSLGSCQLYSWTPFPPEVLTHTFRHLNSQVRLVNTMETGLPFPPQSFHCIISCLQLHWVNDLPGLLAQMRYALKPEGLFLAVLWGEETLSELRQALMQGELNAHQRAAARVSPMLSAPDAAALMQRAGFVLPVVDTQKLTLTYSSLPALVKDLRRMGETASFVSSPPYLSRRAWAEAEKLYRESFSTPDQRLMATFQGIFLTGWAS
jgi:SAM-dependent methyltransferase